jgi:hypothetical protein
MWLLLQSDKGLSSIRLAETLGVSQPTAWRIGHALRLMVAREHMLDSTVEVDTSILVEGQESSLMGRHRGEAARGRQKRKRRRSWGSCSDRQTSLPGPKRVTPAPLSQPVFHCVLP